MRASALPVCEFLGIGFGQLLERLDLFLGHFQQFLQTTRSAEGTLARVGPHPHAVLGDPVHRDQPFGHQRGDDLGEQRVPLGAALRAEVGEHVVVHRDAAAQPLIGEVVLAETFQLPRAADPLERGEHPQRDEQPGIGGVATDMPLDGLDVGEPGVQVEAADQCPDRAGRGVGVEPFVERAPTVFDLIALRHAEPGRPPTGHLGGLLGRGLREFAGQEGEGAHGILTFMRAYTSGRASMFKIIS